MKAHRGDPAGARGGVCGRTSLWLLLEPALLLALGAWGCNKPPAGARPPGSPTDAPVPVKVAVASRDDVPVQLRAIARVEAYSTVTIKPQVAGQVRSAHFTLGQDVKAGDLLFTLDPRPFEARLREAEARLAQDTAMSRDADLEAQRQADLYRQGVATQREYDQSQANAAALQAAVRADAAAVEVARVDLGYCTIRSPSDGRTGDLLVHPGNVVKANETELVVINQVNPIYVTFSVPEQHLSSIQGHQAAGDLPVDVSIPGGDGPPERGVLAFIDNQVDHTTGMIALKARFANRQRRLWPGQFVNVVLTLSTRAGAVVIPSQAIQSGQSGRYVYVVKPDRTVELRPVVVGPDADGRTVIERGVEAGEVVVTDGQLRLVPGARAAVPGQSTSAPESQP